MIAPFQARIDRDLVVVSGPDATSFLQSLVSQDLDPVRVGDSVHSLLLAPQGKLLVDFYMVHPHDDLWSCVCEAGFGSVLVDNLNRFKIRVKVEIELTPTSALAVRGMKPDGPNVHVYSVAWDGSPAYDVVGTADAINELSAALDLAQLDTAAYERARIEAGVPRIGYDVDEGTIPQEADLELDAVSFTKGCFVGQELVCRIDTRGHVNRHLRRFRADGVAMVQGDEVKTLDGKAVGAVTSSAGDVALAMLRREVEPGMTVLAGGTSARVEAR